MTKFPKIPKPKIEQKDKRKFIKFEEFELHEISVVDIPSIHLIPDTFTDIAEPDIRQEDSIDTQKFFWEAYETLIVASPEWIKNTKIKEGA